MAGERERERNQSSSSGISALVGRTFSLRKGKNAAGAAASAANESANAGSNNYSSRQQKSIDLLRSRSNQGELQSVASQPSGGIGIGGNGATDYGSSNTAYSAATISSPPRNINPPGSTAAGTGISDGYEGSSAVSQTVGVASGGSRIGRSGSHRRTAIESFFGSSPKTRHESKNSIAGERSNSNASDSPTTPTSRTSPPPYSSTTHATHKTSNPNYPPSSNKYSKSFGRNRQPSEGSGNGITATGHSKNPSILTNPFDRHQPLTKSNLRPSRSFDSLTSISRRSSMANSTIDSPIETTSGGTFVPTYHYEVTTPTFSSPRGRDTGYFNSDDSKDYYDSPSSGSGGGRNKHSHSHSVAHPIRRNGSISRTLATGPPPRPAISSTTRAKPQFDAPLGPVAPSPYSPPMMAKRITGKTSTNFSSPTSNSPTADESRDKGRIIPQDALSNVHDHMRARQELIGAGPFYSVQRGWKKGVYTSR